MKRGVIIYANNEVEPFDFDSDNELAVLQKAVGGYIECLPSSWPNLTAWCNEDGRAMGLPVNQLATELFDRGGLGTPPIRGAVAVVGGVDGVGDCNGLTEEQAAIFLDPNGEDILNDLINLGGDR